MADNKLIEKLEKLSRECYFDMNQGDNSTFDKIEQKYMRELVTGYGFGIESAKRFVNECELNSGLGIRELISESLPRISFVINKISIDPIIDEFMTTGNLSLAVKNNGQNLDSLENQQLIHMNEYIKNK